MWHTWTCICLFAPQAVAHGTRATAVKVTGGQKASGEAARGIKPANSLLPACQLLSKLLCQTALTCTSFDLVMFHRLDIG